VLYVLTADTKQRLAALLDAVHKEPSVSRRQKREVAMLLSPEEYDRLRGFNAADFQIF
jgi:PHD/YefM family antitoxin component YafN of YafNO toxin-antitoxin module